MHRNNLRVLFSLFYSQEILKMISFSGVKGITQGLVQNFSKLIWAITKFNLVIFFSFFQVWRESEVRVHESSEREHGPCWRVGRQVSHRSVNFFWVQSATRIHREQPKQKFYTNHGSFSRLHTRGDATQTLLWVIGTNTKDNLSTVFMYSQALDDGLKGLTPTLMMRLLDKSESDGTACKLNPESVNLDKQPPHSFN